MDAVYDRGALVAVEPSLRERYAAVVAQRMARSSITLVPIRPRRRGERRSLRTFAVVSLLTPLAFNPRPRRLSTPTDAFQLHPDVRSYGTVLSCGGRARGVQTPPRARHRLALLRVEGPYERMSGWS